VVDGVLYRVDDVLCLVPPLLRDADERLHHDIRHFRRPTRHRHRRTSTHFRSRDRCRDVIGVPRPVATAAAATAAGSSSTLLSALTTTMKYDLKPGMYRRPLRVRVSPNDTKGESDALEAAVSPKETERDDGDWEMYRRPLRVRVSPNDTKGERDALEAAVSPKETEHAEGDWEMYRRPLRVRVSPNDTKGERDA